MCDGGKGVQTGFGKRTYRRPRRRWEESIESDLQVIGWCMRRIVLIEVREMWRAVVNRVMNCMWRIVLIEVRKRWGLLWTRKWTSWFQKRKTEIFLNNSVIFPSSRRPYWLEVVDNTGVEYSTRQCSTKFLLGVTGRQKISYSKRGIRNLRKSVPCILIWQKHQSSSVCVYATVIEGRGHGRDWSASNNGRCPAG